MDKTYQKWCEKLLDIGKRNRLINYKESKLKTIDILSPSVNDVFEMLTSDKTIQFFDVDSYIKENVKEDIDDDIKTSVPKLSKSQLLESVEDELNKNQILAYKNGFTMSKILTGLKKIAVNTLAEKGINILYVGLGFLKWREQDYSDIVFSSPLILIPVKIENDSPKMPFSIREYEDEFSTNPTLLYKLKNDFGLDLPEFRSGDFVDEDVESYLARVQEFVQGYGWSVNSNMVIGTFSFVKLNMYKDLKENEKKILSNKIIAKILSGKQLPPEKMLEDSDIDALFKKGDEVNLHNVVDADSSQLSAIYKAKSGASFVLQGPPGTGKSQTITNLIAEFLYEGKKILFVSEKPAALNVVYDKLKKANLSDFCLELHSDKANKKEFVEELNRSINMPQRSVHKDAKSEVEELLRTKEILDNYSNTLHSVQPIIEKTPFQILGAISKYNKYPKFEYAIKDISTKGIEYFKDAIEYLEMFVQYKDTVGYDYHNNIWYGYKSENSNYESKLTLKKTIIRVLNFVEQLQSISQEINQLFQGNFIIDNCKNFQDKLALLETISHLSTFDGNYFIIKDAKEILAKVIKYNTHKKEFDESSKIVSQMFDPEIFELNIKKYYFKFKNDYISGFRIFNSAYRRDKKIIEQYLINKKTKLKYADIVNALHAAKLVQELQNKLIDEEDAIFTSLKSARDYNKDYDWQLVETEVSLILELVEHDLEVLSLLSDKQFANFQSKLNSILFAYEKIVSGSESVTQLSEYFDATQVDLESMNFVSLTDKLKECLDDFDNIDNWIRCRQCLEDLNKLGLKDFVDESIKNNIPRETLVETFKYLFYNQWIYEIISTNKVLNNFTREMQDHAVKVFKEKDKIKFNIAKAEINQAVSRRMPNIWNTSSGQVGLLLRECNKKRKIKPIRLMMKELGGLIQQIKPCFLMSPLSVSTYLDFDNCKFDVVVFDEASQIFPWDSVGAIARGKQVIVVGDSKQMPPSNFFTASIDEDIEDDDDFYDDSTDFESILDLCSAALGCSHSLNWHYRSRTEDLISFSNKNFYNGKLITFPSAHKDNENMGVNFYHVENGVFDRKSKCNYIEAEKVVDLIFEHFDKEPNRSLGVIAFSKSQGKLIEELKNKRLEQNNKYAKFFDENLPEPFFIKNLETVQGYERDTIIFSVAYAKGSDGRFIHNFGPLNKQGGERRLNVAVTRAKYNVKFVSSIKYYDIDLNATKAEGSRLLREYLECAEHGMQRLGANLIVDPNAEPDSYFEIDVYNVLTSAGYNVDMQVGCSGYRIDLGVRHPSKCDYVLAVEADGATYHSGKTTRDRDRLRQEVLEGLGWRFHRIWSTDWFKNREVEIKKLLSAVEKAIKKFDIENNIAEDTQITNPPNTLNTNAEDSWELEDSEMEFLNVIKQEKKDLKTLFDYYEKYDIYSQYLPSFESSIRSLIETEAPIMEELLLSEVAVFFGREKVTDAVRRSFREKMQYVRDVYKIDDYYVADKNKKITMRIPKPEEEPRDIVMISYPELASGLYVIIENNFGINRQDLYSITAELLGFSRVGNNIKMRFDQALNILIRNNQIKIINDQIFIKDQSNQNNQIEADDLGW